MSMRKVPAKDWVMAFIESENARQVQHQLQNVDASDHLPSPPFRLAFYSLLNTLITKAVDLIRESLSHPSNPPTSCRVRFVDDRQHQTSGSNLASASAASGVTDLAIIETPISAERAPRVQNTEAQHNKISVLNHAVCHPAASIPHRSFVRCRL